MKNCDFVFNSEIYVQRTVLAVFFKRCIFPYIINITLLVCSKTYETKNKTPY